MHYFRVFAVHFLYQDQLNVISVVMGPVWDQLGWDRLTTSPVDRRLLGTFLLGTNSTDQCQCRADFLIISRWGSQRRPCSVTRRSQYTLNLRRRARKRHLSRRRGRAPMMKSVRILCFLLISFRCQNLAFLC